jgi:hypothetical protein
MTLGGSCGGHATRGSGMRMCRKWTQVKESIIRSIKTSVTKKGEGAKPNRHPD